jgi:hypothetical protein
MIYSYNKVDSRGRPTNNMLHRLQTPPHTLPSSHSKPVAAHTLALKVVTPLFAAALHRSLQILPGSCSSRFRVSSSSRRRTTARASSNLARTARAREEGMGSKG